ncbi:hypothetical protein SS50377_27366 [Spironucleus salmonicida]|uniref:Uncharacterized protein n=1 Tax=Spironucleus salmonicida TaxID=348837 RepID=V6LFQ7_9EUKA|nr:hypothetical protein SS50377_27366 [Spironucleus salmonicida]|eukprot:EST43332.1 Hypothetical protein SS50377_17009 [Spironucleus salmonicida]
MILCVQNILFNCFSERSTITKSKNRYQITLIPLQSCGFDAQTSKIAPNNETQHAFSTTLTVKYRKPLHFLNISSDSTHYIHVFRPGSCLSDAKLRIRASYAALQIPNYCALSGIEILAFSGARHPLRFEILRQNPEIFAVLREGQIQTYGHIIVRMAEISYQMNIQDIILRNGQSNVILQIGPGVRVFSGNEQLSDVKLVAKSVRGFVHELQVHYEAEGLGFQKFIKDNIILEISVQNDGQYAYIGKIVYREYLVKYTKKNGCVNFNVEGNNFYLVYSDQIQYSSKPYFCGIENFTALIVQTNNSTLELYPDHSDHQYIKVEDSYTCTNLILILTCVGLTLIWYRYSPETVEFDHEYNDDYIYE